jgi:hypothetical protein
MHDTNSVRLGGVLKRKEHLRVTKSFTSIKAVLRHDGVWEVQLFAKDETARSLASFLVGEQIRVFGHLSRSPDGLLQVVANKVVSELEPNQVDCSHSMDFSVVGYR